MIENHDGLKIEKNVKAHFARSSIRRLKKNVVSRRGSPFSPKKYSRNLIHVLARLFLIQVFLQYTEVSLNYHYSMNKNVVLNKLCKCL